MIIKNRIKKLLCMLFISASFLHCSTTKVSEKSTGFTEKAKDVHETYKKAEDAYTSAEKITSKFKFKEQSPTSAASAPTNIPPPQDIKELPTYGSWMERTFGKVIRVINTVENGANQNFPIVFDLVFVKNPNTYSALTTTTTRDWFRIDIPAIVELKQDTKLLEIQEITAIPEQKRYTYLVHVPAHVQAGLLFVRLIGNDNLYPTVFDPYQDIELDFSGNNFTPHQNK